jgi:hypothetical protein
VIAKELVDNALDICEEHQVAPVIDFSPASEATLVIPRGTPALPPLSPIPRAVTSSARGR